MSGRETRRRALAQVVRLREAAAEARRREYSQAVAASRQELELERAARAAREAILAAQHSQRRSGVLDVQLLHLEYGEAGRLADLAARAASRRVALETQVEERRRRLEQASRAKHGGERALERLDRQEARRVRRRDERELEESLRWPQQDSQPQRAA